MHHEARLDAHRRPVAAVDSLDGAGDETVADVAEAGPAVGFGDGRAEQAQLAHFAQDRAVEILVHIGLGDARLELFLGIALGGVADHPLLVAELVVEVERIGPVERKDCRLAHVFCPGLWWKSASL